MDHDPYEALKRAILEGAWLPGQKLKVRELRETFGLGQAPLREALNRLVGEGLVEDLGNCGFRLPGLAEGDVVDLISTLSQIELMALRKSMAAKSVTWEAAVLTAWHQLSRIETQNHPSLHEWRAANRALHFALVAGCGSPRLLGIREKLWDAWSRFEALSFRMNAGQFSCNHEAHKALVDAVLSGDLDRAQSLLKDHLEGSATWILERLALVAGPPRA